MDSTALVSATTKAPLYDPLTLSYDATTEAVQVEGLTTQAVKGPSEAMQLFARACVTAATGTGTSAVAFCMYLLFLTVLYPTVFHTFLQALASCPHTRTWCCRST